LKIAIVTLGCKLNWFESQALSEKLREAGFTVVADADEADVVVVNTCTVTNRADSKSALVMKHAKKAGKTVVATGCFATTDGARIEELSWADLVVKNEDKLQIPELLRRRDGISATLREHPTEFPIVTRFERTRAFLKIQDGCDHFCSYCKIPHARGRSRSLDTETVLDFASTLLESGYREIVLTGINISSYRSGGDTLSTLAGRLMELPGDFRLRLSSLQPDEFEPSLIGFLEHPKFAPHFHLSLQSGSRTVLERMERPYSPERYLELVGRIREVRPDCGISTDIIAGFPGETDDEQAETEVFIRKARFTRVHLFPYSPRLHTKASRMPDLPEEIKKSRVRRLESISVETAEAFIRETMVGKTQRVLGEAKNGVRSNGYNGSYVPCTSNTAWKENAWTDFTPAGTRMVKGIVELVD